MTRRVLCVRSVAPLGWAAAGFRFATAPIDLDLADLTPAQIKAIKSEPMLIAVEKTVPA